MPIRTRDPARTYHLDTILIWFATRVEDHQSHATDREIAIDKIFRAFRRDLKPKASAES